MILHYLEVAVVFLMILTVLVAAHEFGHYLFARLFGMGVEEFSIGMGGSKPLTTYFRKTYLVALTPAEADLVRARDETAVRVEDSENGDSRGFAGALQKLESAHEGGESELVETAKGPALRESTAFTFRPYPIGGFVRIKGMLPQEDGAEVDIVGGFYSKAPWKRFIVLLAGPMFSVLAGVFVMIGLYMSGGRFKPNPDPLVGTVIEGAASKAGLRTNDRIMSIDGQPVQTFYQVIAKVQSSAGVALNFVYQRDGKTYQTVVTPVMSPQPSPVLGPDMEFTGEVTKHALIGVTPLYSHVQVPLAEATLLAVKSPLTVLNGLLGVVKHPSTAKSVVGGPGTMIKVTSDAVNEGFIDVMQIAAEISISVGIFNLLPIFPLDGGQMLVAIAEMLRGGRRLSIQVQNWVGMVGVATVALLVICVLTVDFGRLTSRPEAAPKVISEQKVDK